MIFSSAEIDPHSAGDFYSNFTLLKLRTVSSFAALSYTGILDFIGFIFKHSPGKANDVCVMTDLLHEKHNYSQVKSSNGLFQVRFTHRSRTIMIGLLENASLD